MSVDLPGPAFPFVFGISEYGCASAGGFLTFVTVCVVCGEAIGTEHSETDLATRFAIGLFTVTLP